MIRSVPRSYRTPSGSVYSFYRELSERPHLLIAGATGSGKSVSLNGIIYTLLMTHSPFSCQFVLVDPKKVELIQYADLHAHAYAVLRGNPVRLGDSHTSHIRALQRINLEAVAPSVDAATNDIVRLAVNADHIVDTGLVANTANGCPLGRNPRVALRHPRCKQHSR